MNLEKSSKKGIDIEWLRENETKEFNLLSKSSDDIGREMIIQAEEINKLLSQIDLDDLPDLNSQMSIPSKFKPVERKAITEKQIIEDKDIRSMTEPILYEEENDKLTR